MTIDKNVNAAVFKPFHGVMWTILKAEMNMEFWTSEMD